ncbi:MAG: insulinase family protein [Bacteroidales bacterium]|nr:insulinase family protein [Bacteroidales bacterium]
MKKINLFFLTLTLTLFCGSILAQTKINPQDKLPMDKDVIYGKLSNGLTYYIKQNKTPENRAELTLAVAAGSIMEDEDQRGLAHFCEHMAFNGSENFPKHELINYLESIGMKFGPEVNAYTSFDETVYGIKVPLDSMEYLDKGLLVLHDWAFKVSYEGEEIDKERGIIHEEWRMNQGAQFRMMEKMIPALFKNSKYAERLPIGLMSVVDSCEYDALRRFYRDWYRPDLMAVIAVGDFDPKMVEQKIKELFGKQPAATNPRSATYPEIPDHKEPVISIATDPEAPGVAVQMYIKHPIFIIETADDYKTALTHSLYNSMINKRLTELTLEKDPPFMYGVSAYSNFLGPKSVYMAIAATTNEKLKRGFEALLTENERVKQHGFTATELEREKKSLLREIEKQLKEKDKRKSADIVEELKGNFLMSKQPVPGLDYEYLLYQQFMPEISLEEINKLAHQWITDENMVVIVTAPEKEGVALPTEDELKNMIQDAKKQKLEPYVDKVSDKPLLAKKPVASKVGKVEKDKELGTETWTLKNGVKVVIKQTDFKDDEILMSSYTMGGLSLVAEEYDVSAMVAADIVMESGVGEFDKIELDKYLSDKIVSVTPYINDLDEGLYGNSSPQDFETMLQLVHLYFTKPRKSENAFEAYMERMIGVYENRSQSPEVAFQDSIQVIMAQYHPRKKILNTEMLKEANLNSAFKIYKERFGDASNFTFYFVGNIDLKTAKPLIETYLGGLPVVNRTETYKDLGIRPPKGKVDKEVKFGKEPKSMVYMSLNGDLDYNLQNLLELKAIGEILSTKLLETIREEMSGVYSIGAYPQYKQFPYSGYSVIVFFGCSPDNIDNLTEGVFKEMKKLIDNGPSEVDLNKAKEKLFRERESDIKENRFWLNQLRNIDYNKLDKTSLDKYNEIVKSMSVESLKKAAIKYLNNENYTRVVLKPE